jgi:hypothetical protein
VDKLIGVTGNVAAVGGALLCVVSGAARLLGYYDVVGVDAIALFTVGIGAMVYACLAKLHLLAAHVRRGA